MTKDRAVHKACQVMRDMDRADRRDREESRHLRKMQREAKLVEMAAAVRAKMVEPMSVIAVPMNPRTCSICDIAPSPATRPEVQQSLMTTESATEVQKKFSA
jgi:hypothetical protein